MNSGQVDVETVLGDVRRLVAIESPTGHLAGIRGVMETVVDLFAGTGAAVTWVPGDQDYGDMLQIHGSPERSEPGVLVLAHVDTVHPLGTLAAELPIRRDGDKVYGPGIYDMKGSFALAIAAYRQIAASGRQTRLPITFLFTPDEEVGSPLSRPTIEAMALKQRAVLVVEPARDSGRVVTARKGVGRYTITTEGRPSHAGSFHAEGRNAIHAMAEIVLAAEALTDYDRGVTVNVGRIAGGTGVNVVPQHCQIELDLRVPTAALAAEMEARLFALSTTRPDITVSVSGGLNRPPYARDAAVDSLFDQASALAAAAGLTLETVPQVGGGSDGNFTAALGIPTLDGLGIGGGGAHTLHEHINLATIPRQVQLLQALMEGLH